MNTPREVVRFGRKFAYLNRDEPQFASRQTTTIYRRARLGKQTSILKEENYATQLKIPQDFYEFVTKLVFAGFLLSDCLVHFPLGVLLFQGLALVIIFLTPSQTDFDFGIAVLEIEAYRHQGKADLLGLSG